MRRLVVVYQLVVKLLFLGWYSDINLIISSTLYDGKLSLICDFYFNCIRWNVAMLLAIGPPLLCFYLLINQ